MNVAIYVRVSTDEQIENYSIGAQTERLNAYCAAKDWRVLKIYTDGGFPGSNMKRPALQSMISDIKKFDAVLVYKLDRLSRSQKDTLYLIEDIFLKNKVEFVSINESLDTATPYGRAMIGILSAFAQLEREQIKERSLMGRTERAKEGYFHGSAYAPLGYDYSDGKLTVNEYEALQIQKIYELALKGHSIHAIQQYMHEHYTNKYSSWSSHISILNCLKNNVYIGKVKFNNQIFEGKHEPIITEELYYAVQNIICGKEREDKKSISQKSPYKAAQLLSCILKCSNCSAGYYSNHGKYTCYSRGKSTKKFVTDPKCKNISWNIQELDSIVLTEIKKMAFDEDYKKNIFENQRKAFTQENNNETIKSRIVEVDKQIERMFDLYQYGEIPLEQIKTRLDKLQDEKDHLQVLLVEEIDYKARYKEINSLLSNLDTVLVNGSLAEKRLLITSLISSIDVGKEININWNF